MHFKQPSYSITSSASNCIAFETVTPRAFAVLRLMRFPYRNCCFEHHAACRNCVVGLRLIRGLSTEAAMCVRKPAPIRSPRRRVASDLGDHVVEPAWAKRGRRGGKDELAHRQRIIVFDLRRKVPVAVEFPRKGLAANQFSGERFTRWSSVTASSSRSRAARSSGSLPLDRAPL